MRVLALIFGLFFCLSVFLDAFQTIILPRRPKGRFRITRLFYLSTWQPWTFLGDRLEDPRHRDQFFSFFGPLSILLLLVVWATLLTGGFGLILFALGSPFRDSLNTTHTLWAALRTDFYVSGTSLFTLGLGDVTPETQMSRVLLVLESGTGLGFVALVIGYVPVLYQAFSHREVSVAMLDGRAGSPPTAVEMLQRHAYDGGDVALVQLLLEWERWSAEVLESHVSYPILCYYRSQHDNQNWLAALISILDSCALLITVVEGEPVRQAQLTFAMARHTLIDLSHIFDAGKRNITNIEWHDRLPDESFRKLCAGLGKQRVPLCGDSSAKRRLDEIRALYEPQAVALCRYLRLSPPLWVAEPKQTDATKTMEKLRTLSEEALRAGGHVSDLAVTLRRQDEQHD